MFRYYLRFKEQYRQIAYDVLQGICGNEVISEIDNSINLNSSNNSDKMQFFNFDGDEPQTVREDNIKSLVNDCRKLLVDSAEDCYGNWALINCSEYIEK